MITWSLDTCYCSFVVELKIVGINRMMDLVSVVNKCSIHDHMGDQGAFSSAWNRSKANNGINQADFRKQTELALELKKETTP